MNINLLCPTCQKATDYDAFKLLGVPVTLFKSFKRRITATTGNVTVTCSHCQNMFTVSKQTVMNLLADDNETT